MEMETVLHMIVGFAAGCCVMFVVLAPIVLNQARQIAALQYDKSLRAFRMTNDTTEL